MKYIESKNTTTGEVVKLSYYDYGSGAPVVLMHGWPLSKEMWEYQVPALVAAGLRVIAYDRRGFGSSDKPWTGYDYDTLTDDLYAVITQLDLNDVTLVGFSMGGGEAARYFTRYKGERVSKVVHIASVVPCMVKTDDNPNGMEQDEIETMINGLSNDRIGFLEDFGKKFFGIGLLNHPVSNALLNYYLTLESFASPRATKECVYSFSKTDFRSDLAATNVPALIIHGNSDKVVSIETGGEKAAQMIPESQYIVYDGAPHGLFYTHRDRLNNDLVNFITTGVATTDTTNSFTPATATGEEYVVLPSNDEGLVTRDIT